ncbi:MAG: ispE [Planctomycetaceae bacterium]|nr:ispE [Planctomycetaceae bacterium]
MLICQNDGSYEVSAPAKLNLFLEILGKRADGYHELETLMVTVSLHDSLYFRVPETRGISLRNYWCGVQNAGLSGRDLPVGSQNLIVKAAELLLQSTGTTQGAQIDLFKRIPLAAGLAGGSSDAAAALVGLNQLWNLKLSPADLREIGAKLGSDVPFFLAESAAALCRGRGEIIESVKLPSVLHFVIAKPAVGLSTAQVFQHCNPASVPKTAEGMVRSLQCGDLSGIAAQLMNRLGGPAERLCPELNELSKVFARLPVEGHLMSGSGTSYFGLCRHQQQAKHLAGRLTMLGLGSVYAVQTCI